VGVSIHVSVNPNNEWHAQGKRNARRKTGHCANWERTKLEEDISARPGGRKWMESSKNWNGFTDIIMSTYVYVYMYSLHNILTFYMCKLRCSDLQYVFCYDPFMYSILVLSAFMSVDALMNREFCCHHIRCQKKLSVTLLTNEKNYSGLVYINRVRE
jgi:hypothetical protein